MILVLVLVLVMALNGTEWHWNGTGNGVMWWQRRDAMQAGRVRVCYARSRQRARQAAGVI